MKQEILMRGQTASGGTEVLEFSGIQIENKNMAYKLIDFLLFPSTATGTTNYEMCGSITAGKTAIAPTDQDFNNEALIGSVVHDYENSPRGGPTNFFVINDTFLITQNLILMVQDTGGSNHPVNWQCRFEAVKMTDAEMAANNFKQYMISDGS